MTGPWIAAFVALALVVIILAVFVLGLFARIDKALINIAEHAPSDGRSLGGLSVGVELSVLDFEATELARPLQFENSIILFASEGCTPCELLVAEMGDEPVAIDGWQCVLVWDGSAEPPSVAPGWLMITGRAGAGLRQLFDVRATPFAFVIDDSRRVIATGVPNRTTDIRKLLESAHTHETRGDEKRDGAAKVTASSISPREEPR